MCVIKGKYLFMYCNNFQIKKLDYNFSYSSVCNLNIHKKKIHQNTEVICEICAKIFKNQYTLKVHMKEHEGNPSREQCDICQKWSIKIILFLMRVTISLYSFQAIFKIFG